MVDIHSREEAEHLSGVIDRSVEVYWMEKECVTCGYDGQGYKGTTSNIKWQKWENERYERPPAEAVKKTRPAQ